MTFQLATFFGGQGNQAFRINDLIIDSKDRENYLTTTSSNFRVDLANPINGRVVAYGLKSAIIPKSNYNIPAVRNTFTIDEGGVSTITITPGNYTMTTLLAEIKTQLDLLGASVFTLTYDSTSGKVTISSTGAAFILNPTLDLAQGSILYKLGFNPGVAYTGNPITAPNVADISGIKAAYIKIKQLTQYMRNTTNSVLNFKIDLNCQFGNVIFFADEGRYHQYFNSNKDNMGTMGFFDVQLVDEYGTQIDLNGRDWSFVIQFINSA